MDTAQKVAWHAFQNPLRWQLYPTTRSSDAFGIPSRIVPLGHGWTVRGFAHDLVFQTEAFCVMCNLGKR